MAFRQMTVKDLIKHLQKEFDGDEPVWFRCSYDPDCCYLEMDESAVQRGGVEIDEVDVYGQCIIGGKFG